MKVARAVGMGAILILALMAGVFIVDTLAAGAAPGAEGEPPAAAVDKAKSDAAKKELEELKKRGYAPLKLKLPTAKVLGTRKDFTTPNLEKNPLAPRKPFWAPKGLTNVAKGKPVTGSDDLPVVGELELLTDGEKEADDGYFMELAPGRQWVQIDLERNYEIFAVVLWHYHQDERVYFDVVVQCADDKDFITNAKTLFNNDHDNSAGLGVGKDKEFMETYRGKLIETFTDSKKKTEGHVARHLRCYSKGSSDNELNHYIEIEVWGRPVK